MITTLVAVQFPSLTVTACVAMACPHCCGDGLVEVIERDGSSEVHDCPACLTITAEVSRRILTEDGDDWSPTDHLEPLPAGLAAQLVEDDPTFFSGAFWDDAPTPDPEEGTIFFTADDIPDFSDLR